MKFKTVPTGVLETLLALGNRLPIPISETFGTMMLARAIEGANNLGIFNYLGKHGPATADEICQALTLNTRIVPALLHALDESPYLASENGRYRNTALTQRFLVEGSPQYVGNFIRYNEQQRMIWLGLEHLARSQDLHKGKQEMIKDMLVELQAMLPDDQAVYNVHHTLRSERLWRNYMYGLRDLANLSIPELQLNLRFPRGITRLLDVGGGHGAYSLWMARRYPGLTATIYDLDSAAQFGREIVEKERLSHRVQYITGDVVQRESFGEGEYDVAFCFNLIHHLTPDENLALIRKMYRSLKPGGSLVIWDEFRDEELKKDQLARFIGVMFLLASGGDTWSYEQTINWMKVEGFGKIKRFNMMSAPGTGLVWGRKL